MPILSLRILPPLAIARFGSSARPLEAFSLRVDPAAPMDFRQIIPEETLEVDPVSGAITRKYVPERIAFRDGVAIRPVAPFLEVFAQTSETVLEPLTLALLKAEGLSPAALRWSVHVANHKVYRQTLDENDKVEAKLAMFSDHEPHALIGTSPHFLPGKSVPYGFVRYLRPTAEFPEIRFRFTPTDGKIYGSSRYRYDAVAKALCKDPDPTFVGKEDRIIYDTTKGRWFKFQQVSDPTNPQFAADPNPNDIYQGSWPTDGNLPVGWGYIDDVCDGIVNVELPLRDGRTLSALGRISSCMPAFAPDSHPVRTVADELEQVILGPEIDDAEVSIDEAAEIVRRALETIRLMNTRVINGNVVDGRINIAHTLGTQETNDFGRLYAPIMASSMMDNLAVRALHERVYAALKAGSAPWFAEALRRPEDVGDLSDGARRKMPPLLRGADGRALTLTRRQISKIMRAATAGIFLSTPSSRP